MRICCAAMAMLQENGSILVKENGECWLGVQTKLGIVHLKIPLNYCPFCGLEVLDEKEAGK